MKEFVVNKKIDIKAEPAEVWNALTDPEMTKKYFFNSKIYSDFKVGSEITFKGKMFLLINFEMHGKILEIDPPRLLKYNLKNSKSSSISVITDTLTYLNGITTVTISDNVGSGKNAEKRYEKSNKGWDKILKGLKELVENRKGNNL